MPSIYSGTTQGWLTGEEVERGRAAERRADVSLEAGLSRQEEELRQGRERLAIAHAETAAAAQERGLRAQSMAEQAAIERERMRIGAEKWGMESQRLAAEAQEAESNARRFQLTEAIFNGTPLETGGVEFIHPDTGRPTRTDKATRDAAVGWYLKTGSPAKTPDETAQAQKDFKMVSGEYRAALSNWRSANRNLVFWEFSEDEEAKARAKTDEEQARKEVERWKYARDQLAGQSGIRFEEEPEDGQKESQLDAGVAVLQKYQRAKEVLDNPDKYTPEQIEEVRAASEGVVVEMQAALAQIVGVDEGETPRITAEETTAAITAAEKKPTLSEKLEERR